ncbi:MAG: GNAT family N-acetyltransferase, partial [Casimicrobiaceae bacterium]
TVSATRPITVRDLLTFRMGFGSVIAYPGTYPIQKPIRDDHLAGDGTLREQIPWRALRGICIMRRSANRRMRLPSLKVLQTERLALRWLRTDDAAFVFRLLNEPSWLKYIGDRGITTIRDAENYIRNGPVDMYGRLGFGLYLVERRIGGESLGICGLIKRESLEDVDLGFAFLPEFWGNGYAYEAAAATVSYGKDVLGLSRIVAIASQDNHPSGRLLEKLGFHFERMMAMESGREELKIYARQIGDSPCRSGA